MSTYIVGKIPLMLSVIIILMGLVGTATAEIVLYDCTSDTDKPATELGYAHSYFDSSTNTTTYLLDTANNGSSEIIEYCVYPNPGFNGMTSDLTPLYGDWIVDRPGTKTYFGFDSKSANNIHLDGSTGIVIGQAKYVNGPPSNELVMLHITSEGWRRASIDPLPSQTPTPTATPTVSPTATPTVSPTPSGDTQPPTIPLCPVAIVEGQTTVNISWRSSTDDVGILEYKVYRSTDNISFYQIATTTNTNYVNTGLTTGMTYYYAIKAVDTSSNPSGMSEIVYATPKDITSPIVSVPSDIMVEATSSSGAIATFLASSKDDVDGDMIPVCTPPSGSMFPMSLTTVTCSATDSSGNVGSAIFSITAVDTIAPTAPQGLFATTMSDSRIDISWTASYDAVGVSQYLIYRSKDNVNFIPIGTTVGTVFQNTGLNNDTVYYYYVVAQDKAGHYSFSSNIANARTSVSPTPSPTSTSTPGPIPTPGPTYTPGPTPIPDAYPTIITPSDMIQEATAPSGTTVTFSSSATDQEDGVIAVTCSPSSGSTFSIGSTTVVCTATDSAGNTVSGMFTVQVVDTTPPTPPSGLTITGTSVSSISLSWTASYDIVGVKTYWIFRSTDGISFIPIGSSTGTIFSNVGLLQNTTYYYVIVAFDAATNPSNPSNIASATTLQQSPNPPPTPGPTGTAGPSPTATADPCSSSDNTQRGQTVTVSPIPSLGIKFDAVLSCGDTTAVAYYNNQWISLPNNYEPVLFYDIVTTSTYSNSITVQVTYSGVPSGINENSIRLFHYENGGWVDVTTSLDTTSNVVTGVVSSLSPFGIGGLGGPGELGGYGSGTIMKGSAFDIVGLIILGICLVTISIFRLKNFEK